MQVEDFVEVWSWQLVALGIWLQWPGPEDMVSSRSSGFVSCWDPRRDVLRWHGWFLSTSSSDIGVSHRSTRGQQHRSAVPGANPREESVSKLPVRRKGQI